MNVDLFFGRHVAAAALARSLTRPRRATLDGERGAQRQRLAVLRDARRAAAPQHGKHVVFGEVTRGLDDLLAVAGAAGTPAGKPSMAVTIEDCGEC